MGYEPFRPVPFEVLTRPHLATCRCPWLLVAWAGYEFARKGTKPPEGFVLVENYHVRGFESEEEALEWKLRTPFETLLLVNGPVQRERERTAELSAHIGELEKALRRMGSRIRRLVKDFDL